jgi:hypothetical protein
MPFMHKHFCSLYNRLFMTALSRKSFIIQRIDFFFGIQVSA